MLIGPRDSLILRSLRSRRLEGCAAPRWPDHSPPKFDPPSRTKSGESSSCPLRIYYQL